MSVETSGLQIFNRFARSEVTHCDEENIRRVLMFATAFGKCITLVIHPGIEQDDCGSPYVESHSSLPDTSSE